MITYGLIERQDSDPKLREIGGGASQRSKECNWAGNLFKQDLKRLSHEGKCRRRDVRDSNLLWILFNTRLTCGLWPAGRQVKSTEHPSDSFIKFLNKDVLWFKEGGEFWSIPKGSLRDTFSLVFQRHPGSLNEKPIRLFRTFGVDAVPNSMVEDKSRMQMSWCWKQ